MVVTSSRLPLAILGSWLLATVGVAFVFLGGVGSAVQSSLHLLVAAGVGLAMFVPDRKLELAGVTIRWAGAALLLMAALAVGLLPIPRAVAAWIAPGVVAARPDSAWGTLAMDAGQVSSEIATFALVLGFGALVTLWGAARYRRDDTETAVTCVTAALAGSALLHAAAGAPSMLGLVAPAHLPTPFFAPFVNPDHAGAMMLLGGPVAVGLALNGEQPLWKRVLAVSVVLAALAVIAWIDSSGAVIAAGIVVALWMFRARGLLRPQLLLVALGLAVGAQIWAGSVAFEDGSAAGRARLWSDTVRLVVDFPLAGTGGGTFGEAVRAYRTDTAFVGFTHAHNDPLEWLAETGVVGLVAAAAALVFFWPGGLRSARRGDGFAFGLAGLALHACVDFPLQLPGVAMAAAAVAGLLVAVFGPQRKVSARLVRGALVAVGLLQLPAAAWQARDAFVSRARDDVYDYRVDPLRAARGDRDLSRAWAGGPERLLYAAWSAEHEGDADGAIDAALAIHARYPDRPDPLREAALVLARAGRYDDATTVLDRVTERDPADFRAWVVLARIARARRDDALSAQHWATAFRRGAPGLDEAYAAFPLDLYWLQAFSDADAHYSADLARILVPSGDLEVALLACEQAARLDPHTYGELVLRAPILVALGRPAEAEAWLRDVLSRRPDDPAVLTEYADALEALGRHEEATRAWLKGARRQPALKVRALASAEVAGGATRALELARRFELDGAIEPLLGLAIADLRLRAGDSVGCTEVIERWRLTSSSVGARALELLSACRRAGR